MDKEKQNQNHGDKGPDCNESTYPLRKLIHPSPDFEVAIIKVGNGNANKERDDPLDLLEIAVLDAVLCGKPDVACTLSEWFGVYWKRIRDAPKFGVRVSGSVDRAEYLGLRFVGRNSANTNVYRLGRS